MLGHTLGAAGAIEAIVSILTIRDGCVPPTINLDDPDPERGGTRPDARTSPPARPVRTALSNSFGFGGQNTALIFDGARPMTDDAAAAAAAVPEPRDGADVELLGLIDRLAELLERSDLSELEVESGGTGLILRKPVAHRRRRVGRRGRRPPAAAADAAARDRRAVHRRSRPGRDRPAVDQGAR